MKGLAGTLLLAALVVMVAAPASAKGPYRAGSPPPQLLPVAGAGAAASGATRWLVGAADSPLTRTIARQYGAETVLAPRRGGSLRVLRVPIGRARALAGELRAEALLRYSEPDVEMKRASRPRASVTSLPADPLSAYQWWPPVVVQPEMNPPAVGPQTPMLAVIDSQLDVTHPEASAGNLVAARLDPVTDEHGTAVAATAAAPANGVGVVGLWPGLPTRVYASGLACGELARAVDQATADGASVINMSFGGGGCHTLYVAVTGSAGSAVMVASGGNEFEEGNVPLFPASWPHVLTVAAVNSQLGSAYFSNENEGIDLAAPGQDIFTAVPVAHDLDGVPDGYTMINGTSFSAPLAAAAAAWTRALRPDLSPDQVSWALTYAAADLDRRGWDQRFGWGLLQVNQALLEADPPYDEAEPNDDMMFINGQVFLRRDAPSLSLRGRRSDSLRGRLDDWEDPDDVYWLAVPARSNFDVRLRVQRGDADLFAYRRRVPTIMTRSGGVRRRGLISKSARYGRRTETLYLRNPGPAGLLAIAVRIYPRYPTLDSRYALSVRRVGR